MDNNQDSVDHLRGRFRILIRESSNECNRPSHPAKATRAKKCAIQPTVVVFSLTPQSAPPFSSFSSKSLTQRPQAHSMSALTVVSAAPSFARQVREPRERRRRRKKTKTKTKAVVSFSEKPMSPDFPSPPPSRRRARNPSPVVAAAASRAPPASACSVASRPRTSCAKPPRWDCTS
jgi:hypothetical protein